MVTIRMFIPYLNMKNRFEAAVSRVQGHCFDGGGPHIHAEAQNIRIDMCHIHSF